MLFTMIDISKVKIFENGKTLFSNDIIPKERIDCKCIPCISVDSILKIEKKYYLQVYLGQCNTKKERLRILSIMI